MREFKKDKIGEFPHTKWQVIDHWKGETVSGGPIVAYFINEKDADEYIWFKTHQHNLEFKTHY
jgi:hypothetical protein